MTSFQLRTSAYGCCEQFKLLIEISAEIGLTDDAADDVYNVGWINDQFARFKMWAGNIGAFADGHASLDYRLRDNEKTRQFMLDFLIALRDFVHRAIVSLRSDPTSQTPSRADSPIDDTGRDETLSIETPISSAISSSFQGTETESVENEILSTKAPETPLPEKRLQNIEKAIDRLYRLSLIIRQPSKSAQNERADHFIMRDEEGYPINDAFAVFARHIVDHQFPGSPEFLRVRLSDGIVTRRKRFLYRQSHQRKLSDVALHRGREEQGNTGTHTAGEAESTIRASKVLEELSSRKSQDAEPLHLKLPAPSHTSASAIPSQPLPLYAALEDVRSDLSTAFTAPPSMSTPIEIPRPPKPAAGSKEFECPYCCLMLPIKELKAFRWRRHVLEDLEPYTCVFQDCSADATLFQDRATWLTHLQAHRFRWRCTSKAHDSVSFSNEEEYFAHMRSEHPKSFTETQLPLLAKRSKVPASKVFQNCPLCSYVPEESEIQAIPGASQGTVEKLVSDRIIRHLAAHLEALAAKALPWQDDADEEIEGRSQTGRAEDITAQSEGGSQFLSFSDSASLHFAEGLKDDITDEEVPAASQEAIPMFDSAYEEDWGFIKRAPYFGHDRDETLQPLLQRLFLGDFASTDFSGPVLPAYLVSVSRDKKFYGRDWALNAMQQTLCRSPDDDFKDNKPPTWPRCFAVYGPGGMGKTQVAANFVSKHRDEFDAVLWVHAEDAGKIAQDYKDLAIGLGLVSAESRDSMDLNYTRDVLKRWLVNPRKEKAWDGEKNPKKASWLLVFDGVEDGEILNSFWPYNGPGSVLVTSRNPYSWSASLELKPFNIGEATQYLFHMTEREPSPEETAAVTTIAHRLGGLPLALSQMGSICASQNISFKRFLKSFEQHEGSQAFFDWRLPDTARSSSNYESNVASVWAFDRLDKGDLLINIISMLDPDSIPESLFLSPIDENDSEIVRTIKEDYITARTGLLARSLITGNKREQKLSVHRLVQHVARARMQHSDIRKYFLACVELINKMWKFQKLTWRHGVARWADCEELFPHVQKLKAIFPSITPSPDAFEDFEFARLLIDSAWYQHERGKSPDAILSNNMAQSICESLKLRVYENPSLAMNNPGLLAKLNHSLLEIAHNRGCIALEINEPSDALKYHKQFNEAMIAESAKQDTEDMRLAISWNELGNAYMLNRDWEKGESCFLQSIVEMRKYVGFKPTTISLPLANLGLAYWIQGKTELASSTLLSGLHDREAEFGRDDRESFITGRFLHALGNVESSLEYHRRALMHYKSTLGNRHHRTADVFVKVAEHNINLGNYEMALALLDHSLDAFSISHTYMPEKTRAGWMRYRALKGLGKDKEARTELRNCYQSYVKLRQKREEQGLEIKKEASELNDEDIDDLIVFWSK